ncbi:MAG: HAD family hydrolase [Oscillospiraceae bacterium]|jgi:HAD superfamily hydrolase (TIGR01509 family)
MIRSAIFDIDGTLLDSMKVWDDLGARYLRSRGVEPEENLAETLFPMTLEEGCSYMKEHYRLPEGEETIKKGIGDIFARFYNEEAELKPGAAEYVRKLHGMGIPMVLATVGDAQLERNALRRLGILGCFKKLFNCGDYGTSKREPLIHLKAAEFLGTKPSETAVFEDTYAAVHSAHTAGFFVAAVEDAASSADRDKIRKEADIYIRDFEKAPDPEEIFLKN